MGVMGVIGLIGGDGVDDHGGAGDSDDWIMVMMVSGDDGGAKAITRVGAMLC